MATEANTTREIQQSFLASPYFAVVGASKDQAKFGTKVLKWYKVRSFQVTPVHPRETDLEGIRTIKTIADLASPAETSISIITPPKITLEILRQGKELSVPGYWLQPGAEDEEVKQFIKENGLSDRTIFGGPCILVEGDDVVRSVL
ncbi:hypothetical protein HGRIS_003004 [Hohenbuehelia grisea]|uniref:CoA-binding domain-containing protein n=1 Tax=Hohenbuehelia grisea TaxID=104357 RepID=A0ABR3JM58_9AGAR